MFRRQRGVDNGFRHLAGTNKMYICHERLIESDIHRDRRENAGLSATDQRR
jgi:hypothetical protein